MSDNTNPLSGIYNDFMKIIENIFIKYSFQAEQNETMNTKKYADRYISAIEETDTFLTYRDYDLNELRTAAVPEIYINMIPRDGYKCIPEQFRDTLLKNRRKKIIDNYDEQNEYYRKLNGYPPLKETNYYTVPDPYASRLGIDKSIPIHKIQDYYNKIKSGKGDYLINTLETYGILNNLKNTHPDEEYLKFIGNHRISLYTSRKARNFQILYLEQGNIKSSLFDTFVEIYEQCRDYFITVIYNPHFRNFIDCYDNFIAMCIMFMAIQQCIARQLKMEIDREFFNVNALRMLYEAYNIPYNMNIDEYTQKGIAQSLNLLIQNKATDKVIFDITQLLGYSNISIYKYYLAKEQKFDIYGVPIIKYTEKFNNDTGEVDIVPDYKAMYDVYFQKLAIGENDFIKAFNTNANREDYEKVVSEDPFWWEDSDLIREVWETEYNFIESKYLSLGISYKMTDIMYENILLLKMLIKKNNELSSIRFTIPKIAQEQEITLFDAVILLCCLTAKKHHLKGEIISIPSQVLSVLDYLHNTDGGSEFLVDSFSFDFDFFKPDNLEGKELIDKLTDLLGEDDEDSVKKFLSYISILSVDSDASNTQKIEALNNIYTNIKGLANFLNYKMSETDDRETYDTLKEFYRTVYYAKEVKDVFTINQDNSETKRTAKNFFEFLYHYNPALYSTVFIVNLEEQYQDYLEEKGLSESQFTIEQFQYEIDMGTIDIRYSDLNLYNSEIQVNDDLIYYYIDHIIYRMEEIVKGLNFIYLINDAASTSLEDLLLKLINFFKSFTVDMLGLDIIYICDLKAENIMRLFDEVEYMKKTIETRENLNLSYSDIFSKMISTLRVKSGPLSFKDKLYLDAILYLDRSSKCNDNIMMEDKTTVLNKEIQVGDKFVNSLNITDVVNGERSDLNLKTNIKLSDKLVRVWRED